MRRALTAGSLALLGLSLFRVATAGWGIDGWYCLAWGSLVLAILALAWRPSPRVKPIPRTRR